MAGAPDTKPKAARCPICGKPPVAATRPFCSRRCADVDLARWLGGRYVVAGGNNDADEDGAEAAALLSSPEKPEPENGR